MWQWWIHFTSLLHGHLLDSKCKRRPSLLQRSNLFRMNLFDFFFFSFSVKDPFATPDSLYDWAKCTKLNTIVLMMYYISRRCSSWVLTVHLTGLERKKGEKGREKGEATSRNQGRAGQNPRRKLQVHRSKCVAFFLAQSVLQMLTSPLDVCMLLGRAIAILCSSSVPFTTNSLTLANWILFTFSFSSLATRSITFASLSFAKATFCPRENPLPCSDASLHLHLAGSIAVPVWICFFSRKKSQRTNSWPPGWVQVTILFGKNLAVHLTLHVSSTI